MHVIATAGHVDHGKSTLVRELTGIEPDRLAEERRRGLTIELGFAWTTLPSAEKLAFVDVPGHEQFVTTMLAGVGPVPAVLFVVAADQGWQAQSSEHLAALDALDVRHGLVAVSRCDLADPAETIDQVRQRLAGTSLKDAHVVTVSGRTGSGLELLRSELDHLIAELPGARPDAPVRFWIDRAFTVTGAGTVVTGTLPAGTLRVGDELVLGGHDGDQTVRIRGLQTLKQQVDEVSGVARVAVNLRGSRLADKGVLARGVALLTPNAWPSTSVIDVALDDEARAGEYTLHIGSAAVRTRLRPLGSNPAARLTLSHRLPLRIGDRALLRDPSRHEIISAAHVRDVRPRPFRRRGAAKARGAELVADGKPDAATLLRWHGILRRDELIAMGVPASSTSSQEAWLIDPDYRVRLTQQLADLVTTHMSVRPGDGGLPVAVASRELGLPAEEIVTELVSEPLAVRAGRVIEAGVVPTPGASAIEAIRDVLAETPFQAPDAQWLADRAIDRTIIAAAEREGALVHLGDGIVIQADAPDRAVSVLADLGGPFTVSQARRALETTRRVAVPLLEYLDRQGRTERIDATTRRVAQPHSE